MYVWCTVCIQHLLYVHIMYIITIHERLAMRNHAAGVMGQTIGASEEGKQLRDACQEALHVALPSLLIPFPSLSSLFPSSSLNFLPRQLDSILPQGGRGGNSTPLYFSSNKIEYDLINCKVAATGGVGAGRWSG